MFILNFLGFVIILMCFRIKDNKLSSKVGELLIAGKKYCYRCRTILDIQDPFCEKCGTRQKNLSLFCGTCQSKLGARAKFCKKCGTKVPSNYDKKFYIIMFMIEGIQIIAMVFISGFDYERFAWHPLWLIFLVVNSVIMILKRCGKIFRK